MTNSTIFTSRRATAISAAASIALGTMLAAFDGCRGGGKPGPDSATAASSTTAAPTQATVRVYVVSDLAGALEPCGCQKDMLGGVDRFASLVARDHDKAKGSLVVSAGPLFFMEPKPSPEHLEQETWKAEAIAAGLKSTGLAAFSPGANDWNAGATTLDRLEKESNAPLVAGNWHLEGVTAVPRTMRDVGGVKVAVVGVVLPVGATSDAWIDGATRTLVDEAKKARAEGARIVVGLAAFDRGTALRIAASTQDLDLLAVGSSVLEGDVNDEAKAPQIVGKVLVVEPSNHLTRVAVVDLFVRDEGRFSDGSGIDRAAEIGEDQRQIDDLSRRIVAWEKDPSVAKKDLDTQRTRVVELKAKLEMAQAPLPTPSGSFFRYDLVEIRDSLGRDATAVAAMKSYYERVNETNKARFAGRRAPTPAKGEAQYVGVNVCKTCHTAAFDVWSKTAHAHAYKTLSDQSKEFNLDCVGCHVVGYEKPGGSSVTDVEGLKDVQCESCHGPGSVHVADPVSHALPSDAIDVTTCATCHHPPHTDVFDFKARVEKIRGPGHGKPGAPIVVDPPKGWVPPKLRF